MSRQAILVGFALCLSLTTANDAAAQRSGFIIGFGLGPGITAGDIDTEIGLSTEFKIGAKVGQSAQVYYVSRMNFFGGDFVDFIGNGVQGLGVSYDLPSAPGFSLNGAVGSATWLVYDGGEVDGNAGFGLSAGFGYEFADLWIFNVAATWGQPADSFNVMNVSAYISILSH